MVPIPPGISYGFVGVIGMAIVLTGIVWLLENQSSDYSKVSVFPFLHTFHNFVTLGTILLVGVAVYVIAHGLDSSLQLPFAEMIPLTLNQGFGLLYVALGALAGGLIVQLSTGIIERFVATPTGQSAGVTQDTQPSQEPEKQDQAHQSTSSNEPLLYQRKVRVPVRLVGFILLFGSMALADPLGLLDRLLGVFIGSYLAFYHDLTPRLSDKFGGS